MVSCWESIRARTAVGMESQEERVECGCEQQLACKAGRQAGRKASLLKCKNRLGEGTSTLIAGVGWGAV